MRSSTATSLFLLLVMAALSPSAGLAYVDRAGYFPVVGDLVKLPDDHDPNTHEDEAVYYIDQNMDRRSFPNRASFDTWFPDFSSVKEIDRESMSRIRLVGNVLYRPGARLVKMPTVPKVYAVEPGGVLRWIESESVAAALYGPDWAKAVNDLSETLFVDYREGMPIVEPVWPIGTAVRRVSDGMTFVIDGARKRRLSSLEMPRLGLQERFVVMADSSLDEYPDGAAALLDADKMTDAGQTLTLETRPPAVFGPLDLAETTVRPGEEAVLYALRLVTGEAIIMRGLKADVGGIRAPSGATILSDFRFEDAAGNVMFGFRQPEGVGTSETMSFSGAYTVPAESERTIYLKARVSPSAPDGLRLSVSLPRSGLSVASGGNGILTDMFWPRHDLPVRAVTVGR
ncbi:MAG: hypothetical protein ABIJ46_01605 [bacterium]